MVLWLMVSVLHVRHGMGRDIHVSWHGLRLRAWNGSEYKRVMAWLKPTGTNMSGPGSGGATAREPVESLSLWTRYARLW